MPALRGFAFLLAVLVVSTAWGLGLRYFSVRHCNSGLQYFLLPPIGTLTIVQPQNWIALFTFLLTAVIASQLAERARRETTNANSRRRELEQLYTFSQQMLTADNVLGLVNAIPEKVVELFGAQVRWDGFRGRKKVYYSDLRASQNLISSEDLMRVCNRGEPITDKKNASVFGPCVLGSARSELSR